jgi:hypothetical protein
MPAYPNKLVNSEWWKQWYRPPSPGFGQIMEKLQILYTFLYYYGVGPPFAFNTAAVLPEMDSYKFWTVSRGILHHSSRRTPSRCFRDVGDGNLFLTLVSKIDQSGSVMFKCGDCAGQGRCWSSPSCSSNHDWTILAVWMGHCRLGKLHPCSEITSGSRDEPDYPTCPRTPLQ